MGEVNQKDKIRERRKIDTKAEDRPTLTTRLISRNTFRDFNWGLV